MSQNVDLIVYTPAVDFENPELKKANELNVPTLSYPEMLGIMVFKNKYTTAISGAARKTTTTAMIGKILMDANLTRQSWSAVH